MRLLTLILLIFITISCKRETVNNRAIYYWKSTFQLSAKESQKLKDNQINTIYLRLFDVDWNREINQNQPIGKISFNDRLFDFQVIPVIYITQQAIRREPQPDSLASRIFHLVNSTLSKERLSFKELQVDCDWTDNSREQYFQLIRKMKELLHGRKISVTIRLHQAKYRLRSGIPPADKGMLMFYNMGKLDFANSSNSIYDEQISKAYTDYLKSYPLQLDVVIPAFSWLVQYRNGETIDLINEIASTDLNDITRFKHNGQFWISRKAQFINGTYFAKNDLIKQESVDPELCLKAAKLAERSLKNSNRIVALFSWNPYLIEHYENEDLETVFSVFD